MDIVVEIDGFGLWWLWFGSAIYVMVVAGLGYNV